MDQYRLGLVVASWKPFMQKAALNTRSVYEASQMTVSDVAFSPRQCPRQPGSLQFCHQPYSTLGEAAAIV